MNIITKLKQDKDQIKDSLSFAAEMRLWISVAVKLIS